MLPLLPIATAVDTMNRLGAAHTPFLFIINYAATHAFVAPLADLSPADCLYHFGTSSNDAATTFPPLPSPLTWQPQRVDKALYAAAFRHVQRNILAGNSYLTNLTCPVSVSTNLTLSDIYHHASARYKLLLPGRFVCFSPEIFVRITANGTISSFPMKGTADASQPEAKARLLADAKEAAEHATIVDLIRNDLSIVGHHVRVERYRYVERLNTLSGPILQTSSEVSAQLPADYPSRIGTLLQRLLPAGSITGAPKPATCRIIAEAERYDRAFYTGVMGISDGLTLDSAVMIRFAEPGHTQGTLRFKAGGGITAQSLLTNEYEEVMQKVYVPIC